MQTIIPNGSVGDSAEERRGADLPMGPGLTVRFCSDDVSKPADWATCGPNHQMIVHLAGRMKTLHTELEGHGGSRGAALEGEIWSIPAHRRYESHIEGEGEIQYALLEISASPEDRVDMQPVAGRRDDVMWRWLLDLRNAHQSADPVQTLAAQEAGARLQDYIWKKYGMPRSALHWSRVQQPALSIVQVRHLRDFVMEGLAEDLSLDEMAAQVGMGTHHLLIAFRKAFGMTPWQYVISQRLRQAQRLLLGTRLEVCTVALQCGFSSHSHLTSVFQKHFGSSPTAFRESSGS